MKKSILVFLMLMCVNQNKAQSITYNHDESFMQQFLFTETGAGSLTPDAYYELFHNSYKNNYSGQSKLIFRTAMALTMVMETPDAKDLDSALVKRAKVEAMNVIDRTPGPGDIAWLSEGPKIENKLQTLINSINNLSIAGAKQETKDWFQAEHDKLAQAVESVREAYMPLNERKLQYLEIYKDIVYTIDKCENAVLYLKCCKLCKSMKEAQKIRRANLANIAVQAHGRWKSTLSQASGGNSGSGGNGNGISAD